MDKRFKEFKSRIDRKINAMDAKIAYMHDGLKGLHEALGDFKEELDMFIDFASENYSDHERRITALEKKTS